MKVLTFKDAIKQASTYNKKNLLLGNGFSIACVPSIFTYSSLLKQADFSKMPEVEQVFKSLNTQDFEEVVNALEYCSVVLPAYKALPKTAKRIHKHAQKLKEILIQTIAKNHPGLPSDIEESKYKACVQFLNNFLGKDETIYSLNYDLLLYWTLMYGLDEKLLNEEPNDGFGKNIDFENGEVEVSDFVTWQGDSNAHGQNIHYLHGALHIFERDAEIEKFTWANTGKPLIEQTREALNDNRFPLFVAEGSNNKKMTKISHSGYLFHSFKSFSQKMKTGGGKRARTTACLFTYGVSFSENDAHVIKKITSGNIKHLFVSMYGKPDSKANKKIIKAVKAIKNNRRNPDFEISYYDAESANVWG
jgi:hypothetical protein